MAVAMAMANKCGCHLKVGYCPFTAKIWVRFPSSVPNVSIVKQEKVVLLMKQIY